MGGDESIRASAIGSGRIKGHDLIGGRRPVSHDGVDVKIDPFRAHALRRSQIAERVTIKRL